MNCIFLLLHATSTCSVLKNLHVLSLKLTGKEMCIFSSHEHIEILANAAGEPLMFRHRDGPYMPTLKLLHKCE